VSVLRPHSASIGGALGDLRRSPKTVAYVDSRSAYDALAHRPGFEAVEVRTMAPALALDEQLRARSSEDIAPRGKYWPALVDIEPTLVALLATLEADPSTAELARPTCHAFVNWAKMTLKTMTLTDADFEEPRIIGLVDFGSEAKTLRRNFPWSELLAENPKLELLRIPAGPTEHDRGGQANADLLTRLRYQSWASLAHHGFLSLWKAMPGFWGRGLFLCARDNPLLREACVVLGSKGYAIRDVQVPVPAPVQVPREDIERVMAAASTVTLPFFRRWLSPRVAERLNALLRPRVAETCGLYEASRAAWWDALEPYRRRRPMALLTNSPVSPHLMAMCVAAQRSAVALVSFQHGHSREISHGPKPFTFAADEHFTDLMIVYNEREKAALDSNPFRKAKIVVAGAPADYRRTGDYRRPKADAAPILYASTTLYAMHLQYANGDWSDIEKARQELRIVDNVLARLPHRVVYKPYPEDRYVDPDPVVARARRAANIDLHEQGVDLRYLIADSRVVVTSRATSTFGWCLLSGRPVVYIEWPNQISFEPECAAKARKAVFFLDAASPTFEDDLRTLLSRPIERLEADYAAMATERAAFIAEYFDASNGGAGAIAARHILEFLNERGAPRHG
jgi:hypothetical protein